MVSSESSDMARPSGRPRKWPRLARPRYNSGGMVARAEAVSVILPVLNERDNLEPLHARLTAALKPLGRDYEIVFVDDGSTDGSWDVMKRLVASDRAVRLVRLRRNFGQTAALAAGLAHSRHPIVVTLDADLQNDPADIPRLLAALDTGDDVVCGWRRDRHDPWLTRRLPSALANRLIRRLTGVGLVSIGFGVVSLAVVAYRLFILGRLEATPLLFMMVIFFLTGVLSVLIGFLADIVIRGFYETQRKPAFYVRETDGMQGVE